MRNNEERVEAVKQRSKELELKIIKRRGRIVRLSSIAACVVFIIGLSFAMPGIIGDFSQEVTGYSDMTASFFQGSGNIGYIVIGMMAFALGVCVTMLCYHTRRFEHDEKAEKTERENDHD